MRAPRNDIRAGLTLAELLVAMGVLALLGALLAGLLSAAIRLWDESDEDRTTSAEGERAFSYLRADLGCAYAGQEGFPDGKPGIFRSGMLPGDRQVLGLTRIGGAHPRQSLPDPKTRSNRAASGANPGGLLEEQSVAWLPSQAVVYVLGTRSEERTLYRMEGGSELADLVRGAERDLPRKVEQALRERGSRLAEGILDFQVRFWTSAQKAVLRQAQEVEGGRGTRLWPPSGSRSASAPGAGNVPQKVEILLLVARPGGNFTLADPVGEKDVRLELDGNSWRLELPALVRAGREWIRLRNRTGQIFEIADRGLFGTRPVAHAAGEPVEWAAELLEIVYLPAHRRILQ